MIDRGQIAFEREKRRPPLRLRNGATFPTAFGTCYCTTIKLFLLRRSWTFHGPLKRRYIYRFLVLETFRGYSPTSGSKVSAVDEGERAGRVARETYEFLRLFRVVRPGWNGNSRTLTRSSSRISD